VGGWVGGWVGGGCVAGLISLALYSTVVTASPPSAPLSHPQPPKRPTRQYCTQNAPSMHQCTLTMCSGLSARGPTTQTRFNLDLSRGSSFWDEPVGGSFLSMTTPVARIRVGCGLVCKGWVALKWFKVAKQDAHNQHQNQNRKSKPEPIQHDHPPLVATAFAISLCAALLTTAIVRFDQGVALGSSN